MKKKPLTNKHIGTANRIDILQYIDAKGASSRTQLARGLSLSKAAVSEHVAQMLEQGILLEAGAAQGNGVGRKSIELVLNGEHRCIIGIDLSANRPLIVLSNLNNEFLGERELETDLDADYAERERALLTAIRSLLQEMAIPTTRLAVVAVCAPGYFNPKTKGFYADGIFARWQIDVLAKALGRALDCLVYLSNDVNAAAVGEQRQAKSKGKAASNLLFIRAGWGLGAGLIIDDKLFLGADGKAGEISESLLVSRKTAVELHSETASLTLRHLLEQLGKQAPASTRAALVARGREPDKPQLSDLIALQKAGDAFTAELLLLNAELLAALICNMAMLLDISEIVLGGDYLDADRNFLLNVNKFIRGHGGLAVEAVPSQLGKYAGIYGLTVLARSHILERIVQGAL